MRTKLLRTAGLLAFALLLVACTRDRPEAEPTATAAAGVTPVAITGTPAADDATATPTPEAPEEAGEEATPIPEEEAAGETFDYTVRAGDTLADIAVRFDTTVQTLRELNFLLDDNIFGGQVLSIPYVEGMTAEGAPTPTPAPFAYTVQPGDTLNSIAIQFDVSPITLVEVNSISDPNNLSVGTELLIPGYTPSGGTATGDTATGAGETADSAADSSAAVPAGNELVVHVVQPGETLNQIAVEYGVDVAALAQANGISNGNLIRVGQRLVIPGLTQRDALEARGTRHVIQSGESLSGIAQRYGVSMEAIMALNSLDDPNTIVVGQELLIPPAE